MIYQRKMIVSGNVVEVIDYGIPVRTGDDIKSTLPPPPSEELPEAADSTFGYVDDPRQRSLQRAKQKLRRTINANYNAYGETSKFVTLTFAENITDVDTANYEWTKFIQRLNYFLGHKKAFLKFSVVVEFTKKGRVHYHSIFYNLPYIKQKDLLAVWGQGWLDIKRIDRVDNVGAYVTKYITKYNDDSRLQKRKSHFGSRGLKKPLETVNVEKIDQFLAANHEKLTYQQTYDTDFHGDVTVRQYKI